MPGLDDTTVAEGLQRLPGWERCGNQLAKTYVRADFARRRPSYFALRNSGPDKPLSSVNASG
jgi:hypothetical protein